MSIFLTSDEFYYFFIIIYYCAIIILISRKIFDESNQNLGMSSKEFAYYKFEHIFSRFNKKLVSYATNNGWVK